MRHPLLTPRWIVGHLLAAVLVAVFIFCGFWQLDRLQQVREFNAQQEAQYLAPALTLGRGEPLPEDVSLRRAHAAGTFEPEMEVLLRSQGYEGRTGYHVLTPFRMTDGSLMLVDRGWVPYEMDRPPLSAAQPTEGTLNIEGWLEEPQIPPSGSFAFMAPRDPPSGELERLFYVDLERLAQQIPGLDTRAWLVMSGQLQEHEGYPYPNRVEPLDEGPHLGYAIQWFSFAVIGIAGYWFLMRNVLRSERKTEAASR